MVVARVRSVEVVVKTRGRDLGNTTPVLDEWHLREHRHNETPGVSHERALTPGLRLKCFFSTILHRRRRCAPATETPGPPRRQRPAPGVPGAGQRRDTGPRTRETGYIHRVPASLTMTTVTSKSDLIREFIQHRVQFRLDPSLLRDLCFERFDAPHLPRLRHDLCSSRQTHAPVCFCYVQWNLLLVWPFSRQEAKRSNNDSHETALF